jgi:hypothetical protein
MSKTLCKFLIALCSVVGAAWLILGFSFQPAQPAESPVALIGVNAGFKSSEKVLVHQAEAPPAEAMAAWFRRDAVPRPASGPVLASPHATAPVRPPPPVAAPKPAKALSFIGTVTVDGKPHWALHDRQRDASFTVAVGGTWAVWTCVGPGPGGLIMKQGEELYVIPIEP